MIKTDRSGNLYKGDKLVLTFLTASCEFQKCFWDF